MAIAIQKIAWVTTIGTSPMAVINTIWDWIKQNSRAPDMVYFICEDNPALIVHLEKITDIIKKIVETYDLPPIEISGDCVVKISDENFEVFSDALDQIIKKIISRGDHKIILDMTPGRKYMSMLVGVYGLKYSQHVHAVYYNHLMDQRYMDEPLCLIPKNKIRIYDIMQYSDKIENIGKEEERYVPDPALGIDEYQLSIIIAIQTVHLRNESVSKNKIRKELAAMDIALRSDILNSSIVNLVEEHLIYKKEIQINGERVETYFINQENPIVQKIPIQKIISFSPPATKKEEKAEDENFTFQQDGFSEPLNKELYLTIKQMRLVINELWLSGYRSVNVLAVPSGLKLAHFQIGERIRINLNKKGYPYSDLDSELKDKGLDGYFREELALENDWFELCKLAGIIEPENIEMVKSEVEKLQYYNPLKGESPGLIGLDTNLFRQRFYSLMYKRVMRDFRNHRIGFLLSDTVRNELNNFPSKFTNEDIKLLQDFISINSKQPKQISKVMSDTVSDFWNMNKYNQRKRRIGFVEYSKVKKYENEFATGTYARTNNNDGQIINEMNEFIRVHDFKLLLLSHDKDFIDMAGAISKINPMIIKYPTKKSIPDVLNASWEQIAEFLYSASIWYGGIVICEGNNPLITIAGIWRGKEGDNWKDEQVKLRSSAEFLEDIDRDLRVINKINEKM